MSTGEQALGRALATDYFWVRDQFTEEQWDVFMRARRFVDEEVLPAIGPYWEKAELPWPLMRRLAELGFVGAPGVEFDGCAAIGPIAFGLLFMELNRGDGSLATFLGVQAGLAMRAIALHGSEEQKSRWLPAMSRLDAI